MFTGNSGTGIYNDTSSPQITNCIFTNNTDSAIYNNDSTPAISRCQFLQNQGAITGAAINNNDSSPQIQDSIFLDNSAMGGGFAIYNNGTSSPVIARCRFENNSCNYEGGAMFDGRGSSPLVRDSLFDNNAAGEDGGAIAHYGGSLSLVNCTIADNTALISGGGLYNDFATLALANTIVWHNALTGTFPAPSVEFTQILTVNNGTVQTTNCIIQGLSSFTGTDDLAFDPLFLDAAAGNYQVSSNSPALNAGNNLFANAGDADLSGSNRLFGAAVDLGAYELQGAAGTPATDYVAAANDLHLHRPGRAVDSCDRAEPNAIRAMAILEREQAFSVNAINGGDFQIQVSDPTDTLTVLNPALANGTLYRFLLSSANYTSPIFTLNTSALTQNYLRQREFAQLWGRLELEQSTARFEQRAHAREWLFGHLACRRPISSVPHRRQCQFPYSSANPYLRRVQRNGNQFQPAEFSHQPFGAEWHPRHWIAKLHRRGLRRQLWADYQHHCA